MIAADRDRLVLIRLRTKELAELGSVKPARVTALPSIAVTPDNRTVFVSVNYEQASIWLVDLRDP